MALVKGLSRIDKDGRIAIPKNIRKEAGLRKGQLVEIRVLGTRLSHINIKAYKKGLSPFLKNKNNVPN